MLFFTNRHFLGLTPWWKQGLVFWHVFHMPLCQGSCMDPIWPEFEIWKIFYQDPAEILAPWTPGVSHGTKIFGSKFFFYHKNKMLFYALLPFILQKFEFIKWFETLDDNGICWKSSNFNFVLLPKSCMPLLQGAHMDPIWQ